MSLLARGFLVTLNALLARNTWAMDRLAAFQGRSVRFSSAQITIDLSVNDTGQFASSDNCQPSVIDVEISLPSSQYARLLEGKDAFFSGARLSGSADFAETLGFVLRHLQWNPEDDLSGLLGDIPGRRVAMLGNAVLSGLFRAASILKSQIQPAIGMDNALQVVDCRTYSAVQAEIAELNKTSCDLEARISRLG